MWLQCEQPFFWGGALHDEINNGCAGDYINPGLNIKFASKLVQYNTIQYNTILYFHISITFLLQEDIYLAKLKLLIQ